MSRRRIRSTLLACAAIPAAIIAGCGGGGGGSVDVGPAAAVPASTPIYLDATVKPTGAAKSNADAALGKILNTPDPGAKIVSLIEDRAKSDGHPINYQQDIAPWLGGKAAVFFTSLGANSKGVVVVETTNPAASLAFAQKASGDTATDPAPQGYNGATYQTDKSQPGQVFGTVGNFLVEGDLTGFKAAVDANKGDSLGDSSDFKNSIADLPGDRLGTLYTVPKDFITALGPNQLDPNSQALLEKTAGNNLDQPVAGALTASANTLQLEATGGSNGVETPESSLLGGVPGQSWLAFGLGDLGGNLKNSIDQLKQQIPNFDAVQAQIQQATGSSLEQLTGAIGDAVLYVQGTTQPKLTGALIVQSKNTDLTGRLLTQLQSLLRLGSGGAVKPLRLSGGGTGFQINDPSVAPRPVELAQQGDKLVIGYGAGSAEASLAPAQTLSDSPTYSAAHDQISSLGTDLFLDMPSIFALAESSGAKSDPGYAQAKPYLDALTYLVTGSGSSGDKAEFKAVLGLK
ncbi:MAG: DUF3352 domain-containing protein [Solirubrobacterales bacterium]